MKRRGFIKNLALIGIVPVITSMTIVDLPTKKLASDISYEHRKNTGMVLGKTITGADRLTIVVRGYDDIRLNDLIYSGDEEYISPALVVAFKKIDSTPTFEVQVVSIHAINTIEEAEYFHNSFKFRSTVIGYRRFDSELKTQ